MGSYRFVSNSPEETFSFAEKMAAHLKPGDVLLLEGDLGAGKTTFTKGIANGLGIRRTVNSPTFTIIKEYRGNLPLYHMDVYRLEDAQEDLGFDEYFEGDGVTVVEWAHFIKDLLPESYLEIRILRLEGDRRLIEAEPFGDRYVSLCEEIFG
ncbi:tRNA (adenosine(37)-N6)-threonylcarbamoyltransferase complex ATPase subunit type 1 TsaE [Weizmannia coagulans]|jgi:tRNA threonylcarbamoyladenosine biosynthesis protein TsaE|nr:MULTISPECIES: tRNA (adenosine(37)-N6)-threonylcarbamoyltransferase complex ATPase subunit type 1 TsaE [Heyndrickxia]AEP00722.1 Uncharacterized protein family UPF0079, ATPase [Heyndrickxia coagulans 36D1]AKN53263.1 TsaE protein [Heyndrickxia coagulans]APB37562.1 tRNA (adenosine(37)-N6)-threonylcarbamoyltransferase complex ATPase subunit type 1 TsaE [Heyndrickxia coagulans]ATW81762.1 tRNA (adenosine(37)-N6)-threonylcarbamoyltransferase complex ATPase subunit type 1 TsaE [Heyndrickxia coagulans